MGISRKIASISASIALAAGLSVGIAGPASAVQNCFGSIASDGAYRAQCSQSQRTRAWVACKAVWSLGYTFTRDGAWVGPNQVSVARCGAGEWSLGYGGWQN